MEGKQGMNRMHAGLYDAYNLCLLHTHSQKDKHTLTQLLDMYLCDVR